MSEWISVDDGLPDIYNGVVSEPVLVVKDCGPGTIQSVDVTFAWHDDFLKYHGRWNDMQRKGYRVTHWQPAPTLPETAK